MKENTYYVTHSWMISELHLKGVEKDIYAIIYGFTQDGQHWFHGTRSYLCEWTGANKSTISRCIQSLIDKGLLQTRSIMVNGKRRVEYKALQNATNDALQVAKCNVTCCKMQPEELQNATKPLQNATHDNIGYNLTDTIREIEYTDAPVALSDEIVSVYNQITGSTYHSLPYDVSSYHENMGGRYTLEQYQGMIEYWHSKMMKEPDWYNRCMKPSWLLGIKHFEENMNEYMRESKQPRQIIKDEPRHGDLELREDGSMYEWDAHAKEWHLFEPEPLPN